MQSVSRRYITGAVPGEPVPSAYGERGHPIGRDKTTMLKKRRGEKTSEEPL